MACHWMSLASPKLPVSCKGSVLDTPSHPTKEVLSTNVFKGLDILVHLPTVGTCVQSACRKKDDGYAQPSLIAILLIHTSASTVWSEAEIGRRTEMWANGPSVGAVRGTRRPSIEAKHTNAARPDPIALLE